MIAHVSKGRLKPGKWSEFERLWREHAKAVESVAGARGRMLLHDTEDDDAGCAVSFWDSVEAFRDYERTRPPVREMQDCFNGDYESSLTSVSSADLAHFGSGG